MTTRKKELSEDFKDIENRYKTELVKLKTTEMANDDLQKYSKALDACVFILLIRGLSVADSADRAQRHHALPQHEDGRDQRHHRRPVEQDVPGHW